MEDKRVELTEKQKKAQRARNIAIAILLVVLAITFYVVTIFKFGPDVLNRPMG